MSRRLHPAARFLPLLAALTAPAAGGSGDDPRSFLPGSLLALGSAPPGHALLVEKETEKLFLFEGREEGPPRLLRVWNATTGQSGGDKAATGDHRTPEGIYFFTRVLEDRDLPAEYGVRALVTDYPNRFDQRQGKTGHGIWLHASDEVVRPFTAQRTRGCVVVTNHDVLEVSRFVALKRTPIVIEEAVERLEPLAWESARRELLAFLESWRRAWSAGDLAAYRACYAREFRSEGKDREAWVRHKATVAESAGAIEVELVAPTLLRHGEEAVAQFGQVYRSAATTDYGDKTLWLTRERGRWSILGEEWQPAAAPATLLARHQRPSGGPSEPVAPVVLAALLRAEEGQAKAAPTPEPTLSAPTLSAPTPEPSRGGRRDSLPVLASTPPLRMPRAAEPRPTAAVATPGPPAASPSPLAAAAAAAVPAPLPFTVQRFLADAGDGEVRVNFRLERNRPAARPLAGWLALVVQVRAGDGALDLVWPRTARVGGGQPLRPRQGDAFAVRRFKEVDALLTGLPRDAVLESVRVFVYDERGQVIQRQDYGG